MVLDFLNPELIITINKPDQHQTPIPPEIILNLIHINLIRDDLQGFIKFLKPEHGKHLIVAQLMELLKTSNIPSQKVDENNNQQCQTRNLILPNCIMNTWHDFYNGLLKLINMPEFWEITGTLNWIDARNITFHNPKLKNEIVMLIENLLSKCKTVLITPPTFMLLTDFWQEILSKIPAHERIIFFTKKQSRIARTTAATIIPEHIAKIQTEFYKSNQIDYRCRMDSYLHLQTTNKESIMDSLELLSRLQKPKIEPEKPFIIIELQKMQKQIEDYFSQYPEAANLETGMLLEKINDIRESLGFTQ